METLSKVFLAGITVLLAFAMFSYDRKMVIAVLAILITTLVLVFINWISYQVGKLDGVESEKKRLTEEVEETKGGTSSDSQRSKNALER